MSNISLVLCEPQQRDTGERNLLRSRLSRRSNKYMKGETSKSKSQAAQRHVSEHGNQSTPSLQPRSSNTKGVATGSTGQDSIFSFLFFTLNAFYHFAERAALQLASEDTSESEHEV